MPSLKFPVMVELISLTSRFTSISLFWKIENRIATAGIIDTTNSASFAFMENMTTTEPIRYVECQIVSMSVQDASDPILDESLIILACR